MRVSEAMRLGAMMHPQTTGKIYNIAWDESISTCALGAVMAACGALRVTKDKSGIKVYCATSTDFPAEIWRALTSMVVLPVEHMVLDGSGAERAACMSLRMDSAIVYLNDSCCWTRERIADWVETVEPGCVVPEVEQEAVAV